MIAKHFRVGAIAVAILGFSHFSWADNSASGSAENLQEGRREIAINSELIKKVASPNQLNDFLNNGKKSFPGADNLPSAEDVKHKRYELIKALKISPPPYPKTMLMRGIEASVRVYMLVSEEGHVIDTVIVESTDSGFNPTVVATVKNWIFEPAKLDGIPCKAAMEVPIEFRL